MFNKLKTISIIFVTNIFLLGCDYNIGSAEEMAEKSQLNKRNREQNENKRKLSACRDYVSYINEGIKNATKDGERYITRRTSGLYCTKWGRGEQCLGELFSCKEELDEHILYLKEKGYKIEERSGYLEYLNEYYITW